jgi:hypothetical protein
MRDEGLADFPDPDDDGRFRFPARLRPPQGEAIARGPDAACNHLLEGAPIKVGPDETGGS